MSGPPLPRQARLFLYAAGTVLLVWHINVECSAVKTKPTLPTSSVKVRLGNDIFITRPPREIWGRRLGLVINHTAVLSDGTPLYKALQDKGLTVAAIFAPEHGFSGRIRAGEDVAETDLGKIRVFSLYGQSRRPTREQLKLVDALVYDIQDVGTRFYTYITTLKYVLEAAARSDISAYVLDRPNPAGGDLVEGPLLRPEFESFIGALPIPIRYGLTCGELAAMMKGEGWIPQDIDLHIIPMEGWTRSQSWEDTGLRWIPPSPNIPHPHSAVAYPGTGLLGGIKLNQGLGTDDPFLRFGAPWMDPEAVLSRLPARMAEVIGLVRVSYTPRAIPGKSLEPPYRDQLCRGLKIRLKEPASFSSVHFTLHIIDVLKQMYPQRIFRDSETLTLMYGTGDLARYLRGEMAWEELMDAMRKDEELFRRQRRPYIIY